MENITFDDRQLDIVKYNNLWFITGNWNASNIGETGTLSSSNSVDANLTFTFPEPANAFYYYGIPRCCGGRYAICIDCDPNNRQFIDIDAVNTTDDGGNAPIILFSKTFDSFGVHEIILKNQEDSRFGKSQITLDRFELQVVDKEAVSSKSSSQTSASSSLTSTQTTQLAHTASIHPAPSTSSSSAQANSSSVPVAPISAGISVAVVIIIAICLWICCRRRRRQRQAAHPESGASLSHTDPHPFLIHAGTITPAMSTISDGISATRIDTSLPRPGGKRNHSELSSPDSAAKEVFTPSITTRPSSRERPRRREMDAGPIEVENEDDDDDDTATLPPEYDQVFRPSRRSSTRTLRTLPVPPVPSIPPRADNDKPHR